MTNKAALTLEQVEKVNGGERELFTKVKYGTDATAAATADADDDNFHRIRIM